MNEDIDTIQSNPSNDRDPASSIGSPDSGADSLLQIRNIAVVGLGYVGLPLSLQFAGSGVRVTGLDVDQ
jgi:hypothetical protein